MNYSEYIGMRFGKLTVIEQTGISKSHKPLFLCHCDCGNEKVVDLYSMRSGHTQSCGCYNKERLREANTVHGGSCGDRLHTTWGHMVYRCSNKNMTNYGGRGISVCEEWRNSYESFRDWALGNGYRDDLTIDRIDNNGNYCPENCRWATNRTQANNTRRNHNLTAFGETKTVTEWSRVYGVKYNTILSRLNKGWSVEAAISTPPYGR